MEKLNSTQKSIAILGTICIALTFVVRGIQDDMVNALGIPVWGLCLYTTLCVAFGIVYVLFIISLIQARNGRTKLDLTGK